MFTSRSTDDRKPIEDKNFIARIAEKLVGDNGYISKTFFEKLFADGIQPVTMLKSDMKGTLMSVSKKLLARKRATIGNVNDELKNIASLNDHETSVH